jgi:hypothetical protein
MVKRAREQALREKRERKQAKKDARDAERQRIADGGEPLPEFDAELDAEVGGEVDAEVDSAAPEPPDE